MKGIRYLESWLYFLGTNLHMFPFPRFGIIHLMPIMRKESIKQLCFNPLWELAKENTVG